MGIDDLNASLQISKRTPGQICVGTGLEILSRCSSDSQMNLALNPRSDDAPGGTAEPALERFDFVNHRLRVGQPWSANARLGQHPRTTRSAGSP